MALLRSDHLTQALLSAIDTCGNGRKSAGRA
jgi:hypothetical protein